MSLHRGALAPISSPPPLLGKTSRSKSPSLYLAHYPARPHRQEIIFHAKLSRPLQRDFLPTPRHSPAKGQHKRRGWREGGGGGKKGKASTPPSQSNQGRVTQTLMIHSCDNWAAACIRGKWRRTVGQRGRLRPGSPGSPGDGAPAVSPGLRDLLLLRAQVL